MKLMDEAGIPARASALRQADVSLGKVTKNRLLTAPDAPAKRHIEFELPEGTGYQAGDYLAMSVSSNLTRAASADR
jgi:cytochrome P450/NADPH-cytochrome P450 reductase